jgi:hypothetical protein
MNGYLGKGKERMKGKNKQTIANINNRVCAHGPNRFNYSADQLTWILPTERSANCWKAAGDKSKPLALHPGQLSSTVTVTLLPSSVMKKPQVSGGYIFVFQPNLQLTSICRPQTELSLGKEKKQYEAVVWWKWPTTYKIELETATTKSESELVTPHAPKPATGNIKSASIAVGLVWYKQTKHSRL